MLDMHSLARQAADSWTFVSIGAAQASTDIPLVAAATGRRWALMSIWLVTGLGATPRFSIKSNTTYIMGGSTSATGFNLALGVPFFLSGFGAPLCVGLQDQDVTIDRLGNSTLLAGCAAFMDVS